MDTKQVLSESAEEAKLAERSDLLLKPVCPLRRLQHESPGTVLPEFVSRANEMPFEHKKLMKLFQEKEDIRRELDEKFGDDKEKLIEHLWRTHKGYYRPLTRSPENDARIEKWLEELPESNGREDGASTETENGLRATAEICALQDRNTDSLGDPP